MNIRPTVTVRFLNENLSPFAETHAPRKVIIKGQFGGGPHQCWLELYNEDRFIPAVLGHAIEVRVNESLCFRGRLIQRRVDSIDDQLAFFAQWQPQQQWNVPIHGVFENQSATDVLDAILSQNQLPRIHEAQTTTPITRLEFSGQGLIPIIDLLAKLAGNWLWDITIDGALCFRPPNHMPEHWIHLFRDHSEINIWQTAENLAAAVAIQGGMAGPAPLETFLEFPQNASLVDKMIEHAIVRPIVTADGLALFKHAVRRQMAAPHYSHYVDLLGRGEGIQPGSRVRFTVDNFALFPQEETFRVKQREITYAHENLRTRLHLTSGFESASSYFHHLRSDQVVSPGFMLGRTGAFQLDVSGLDTAAHLDAA